MTDTPDIPYDTWMTLAEWNTASERRYDEEAEKCWRSMDLNQALFFRGVAEGLRKARDNQLAVRREVPPPPA